MRSLFLCCALLGMGTAANGQDDLPPRLPAVAKETGRSVSPPGTVDSGATRRAFVGAASDSDAEHPARRNGDMPPGETDTEFDDIPIGDYPRDPAWPTWDVGDDRSRQPISAPGGYYDLVRPPAGISPDETGQEYTRPVYTEGDLFYHRATNAPPIDFLHRPDGMAPAGVFGDHTLNTGGRILLSHRFENAAYDGLLSGTQSVSIPSVLRNFPIAPTRETAQTHYFLFEYGPTDDLTLQVILPIVLRKMDYLDGSGNALVTDITDLYDMQFNTMYVLHRWDRQQIHANLGLRAPLGVFDELGQVPTPTSPDLTYPMRTSDGTWDFLPGLTYRGQSDWWTWGAQALGTVRFGINRYGYRLGDDATLNGWVSRRLTDWVSASVRLNGQWWGNIYGADQRLNPDLVPTNRTNLQGGERLNILFGLNFVIPQGLLQGQRLGIEGGIPIYQNLSGPQLQQRYDLWTNLTITF